MSTRSLTKFNSSIIIYRRRTLRVIDLLKRSVQNSSGSLYLVFFFLDNAKDNNVMTKDKKTGALETRRGGKAIYIPGLVSRDFDSDL